MKQKNYNKYYGALIAIILISFLYYCNTRQQVVEEPQTLSTMQLLEVRELQDTAPLTDEDYIIEKIKIYFVKSNATMIAIAYAESGLDNSAINYNCYYNDDYTKVYETRVKGSHGASCKVQDRKYAFGVDCFVLQAHYPGRKDCPKDVSLDQHLEEMAELSRQRNFQPWSAYNNKSYLKFLATN